MFHRGAGENLACHASRDGSQSAIPHPGGSEKGRGKILQLWTRKRYWKDRDSEFGCVVFDARHLVYGADVVEAVLNCSTDGKLMSNKE